jgi:transcriptional regulator with XRE-family HTH domain
VYISVRIKPISYREEVGWLTVGDRVRELRQRKGLSGKEVAARAGIPPETLSRIENGKMVPSAAMMEKLAHGLGVPAHQIADTPGKGEDILLLLYRSLPLDKQRWVVQQLAAMAAGMEVAEDFHPQIGDEVAVA